MAEGEGFEPPRPQWACRFSRPVHSTRLCHPSKARSYATSIGFHTGRPIQFREGLESAMEALHGTAASPTSGGMDEGHGSIA